MANNPNLNTNEQEFLSIKDAADLLSVSTKTLRRWEKSGQLIGTRTDGGHRRYQRSQILTFRDNKTKVVKETVKAKPQIQQPRVTDSIIQSSPIVSSPLPVQKSEPVEVPQMNRTNFSQVSPQLYESLHSDQKSVLKSSFAVLGVVILLVLSIRLAPSFVASDFGKKIGSQVAGYDSPLLDLVAGAVGEKIDIKTSPRVLQAATEATQTTFVINIPFSVKDNADIAGTLNLSGNTLTSADDLLIAPTGSNVLVDGTLTLNDTFVFKAGGLTSGTYNSLANSGEGPEEAAIASDNDLYLGGDLELDGNLIVGTDSVNDIAGTGLQVVNGVLSTTLGTDVSSDEIEDNTIVGADVNSTNAASNGYALTYDSSSGGFTWLDVSAAVSGSGFTDTGVVVQLTTTTDDLSVGGTTSLGKLSVDGDSDEVQFLVQGNSTQTNSLLVLEQSDGTDVLSISNGGVAALTGQLNVDNLQLDGTTVSTLGNNDLRLDPGGSGNLVFVSFDCTGNANGGALTADASGVITCSDDAGGGTPSPFQVTGTVINAIVSTNDVTIGSATNLGKFAVDGDSDEIQLLVQGNATQTTSLIVAENSAGTDRLTLDNSGNLAIEGQISDISDAILTVNDNLTVLGSIVLSGTLSNSAGNLVLDDTVDIGSATTGIRISPTGDISDIDGVVAISDNTNITGNLDISGTLASGTSDAFQVDANGNISSTGTTGVTLSGNDADLTFTGTVNHDITASSGTLRLGAHTLTGGITGNSQTITGLSQLTVDNLRLDGNTLDTTSGNLTLDSTGGTTTIADTLTVTGTINGITVAAGVITSGTWNGTTIGPTFGGTGVTTVTTGDLLYGSGSNVWGNLGIGTIGQVLSVSGGIPTWTTVTGGLCPTCVITNPSVTQTITHPAGVGFALDSDTTNSTLSSLTAGVFDINVGSTTADNVGFTLDYSSDSGVASGNDLFGSRITVTQNDLDGDLFGVMIRNGNTTAGAAASTDDLLVLDNVDTDSSNGGILDNGLRINSAGAVITDAIDASDAEIVNALNVGDNTILGNNAIIDFNNFDVASSGNITAGTYNGQTISSTANFTGTVAVTTSVTSPLYTGSGAVTLSSAGGAALTLDSSSGVVVIAAGDALQVTSGNINSNGAAITIDSGAANQVNIGASDAFSNGTWTISGAGAITGVTSIVASSTISANVNETINGIDISAGTVSDVVDLTINTGGDLTIGTIGLNDLGTSNLNSGASLIGTFDEFTNSNSTNVQDVLDDLDSAIGAGASKWTDGGAITYLTQDTDNLAVGGVDATSEFFIDIANGGNVAIKSTGTTQNPLDIDANSLTTGSGIDVSSTSTAFNGELLVLNKVASSGSTAFTSDIANITYSQTFNAAPGNSTGNVLDISRAITIDDGAGTSITGTVSGALATLSDNCSTGAADTCTHTANVLFVDQNYGSSTGDVLSLENAGTGDGIQLVSQSTGTLLNLDATGVSTTVATAFSIEHTQGTGVITTAIDISDAEIVTALAIGSNDVTVGGATISSAEFAILDNNISLTTEVTGILPVGNGGTGVSTTPTNGQLLIGNGTNYTVAALTQGNGMTITNGSGSITLDVDAATSGTTAVTSSNSGIESLASGIRLLGGCSADQILKWDGSVWACSTDAGSGTGSSKWTESGGLLYPNNFATDDLAIGSNSLVAPFSVDESLNTVRVGEGSNNNGTIALYASDNDTGSLIYNTSDQFEFSGGDVKIDQTLSLSTGAGAGINGGGLVDCDGPTQKLSWDATTEEFLCGTDSGSGSGGSKWTAGSNTTYLTDTSSNLTVGAGDTLTAPLAFTTATNVLRIGDGVSDANDPTITFFASDATNSGSLSYLDTDRFSFTGGDVSIAQKLILPSFSLTATGTRSDQVTTFDSTASSQTLTGTSIDITNNPTTNANTGRGLYVTLNDAGSLANTVYGAYLDVTTANANDLAYGLAAQGDTADILLLGGKINSNNVAITLDSGSANSITLGSGDQLNLSGNFSQTGTGTFSTGTGSVSINGNTTFASGTTITQSGTGQVTLGGNVDVTNGLDVTGASLTVGGANFSVAPASGNTIIGGTLGVTGLITASGGETIAANQNLTMASGTGTFTQNFTNNANSSATTHNVTNSAGSGTVTVNGINIALTGTGSSGTNTNNGLRLADVTGQANNTFTALSIGDNYNNLLQYENGGFTGSLQGAGLSANRTYTLPNADGTICLSSNNCTFISNFTVTAESGTNQTISSGDTLSILAGVGIDTVASNTDNVTISIQNDSLDYAQFEDTLDLDASLTTNNGEFTQTNNWDLATDAAFTGNTLSLLNDLVTDTTTQRLMRLVNANDGIATGITDRLLVLDNADANEAVSVALEIVGSSTGTITTAVDVSDAEIDTAVAIGSNDVTVGGVTIQSSEFALLDGRSGTLVDSANVGSFAVTTVTAGNGLTSGGGPGAITLHVGAGTGIVSNADDVAIDTSIVPRKNVAETITGGWTFNSAATTFTTGINANGGITTTSGGLSLDSASGTTTVNDNLTVTGTINGLTVSAGTITAGTWNGTAIGATYGGTGLTSVATGDLIYGSGTNTWANRTIGTAGQVLAVSGGLPVWTTVTGGLCPTCVITNPSATQTITNPAGVAFALDSDTTNSTLSSITDGVFDINVGSVTNNNVGFTLDYTSDSGVTSGNDLFGGRITVNQNDADGDLFGLVISNGNTTTSSASTDDLLVLSNADTDSSNGGVLDNALRITTSGGTITDGIQIGSGSEVITNAINIGSTGVVTDIILQNSETIDNNVDGTILFTAATTQTTGNLTIAGTGGLTLSGAGGDITFANAEKIDNDSDGILAFTSPSSTFSGDITVSGGDVNGPTGENINLGTATTDVITLYIGGTGELDLTATTLRPTSNGGLDLGSTANKFGDLFLQGGDIALDNATDIDIDDNLASSFTISEGTNEYLNISTTNTTTSLTLNLPVAGSSSTTGNLFTSNADKTINLGTGTGVDTINIGTGGTGADVITIGSANAGALTLIGGANSLINFPNFDVATSGNITVAVGQGLDTNAAGALNLGVTNATSAVLGSAALTSFTVTTDGTGNGEVVLPTGSIATGEILDDTLTPTDFAATLTFAALDLIDMSPIIHNTSAPQGLKLPQNTALTNISGGGEGYLAYDTDDNQVLFFDGSTWNNISGASTTLQDAYNNDANSASVNILTTATDGDLIIQTIAGTSFQIAAAAAPTEDMMVITNTGFVSATDGVDAFQVTFSTDDASGNLLDLTASFTDNDANNAAETWNVIDIDGFTVTQNDSGGAVTGLVNGLNIGNLTETATGDDTITSTAIRVGTGWDNAIELSNGATITQPNNADLNLSDDSITLNIDFGEATGSTVTLGTTSNNLALVTTTSGNITLTAGGSSDYIFAVDSDTNITTSGGADGTDAISIPAGDILLSDGDLDLSGGDFNVLLDAADSASISLIGSTTSAGALAVTNTSNAANVGDVTGQSITFTLANYADDGAADTRVALDLLATNNATDAGTDDNIYGIRLQDLAGSNNADGVEYGIYQAGTNWDYGLYITDNSLLFGSLQLGADTQDGQLILYNDAASGGDWTTTIGSSTSQDANITYVLPPNDGTAVNQVLATNGTGTLTWASVSGVGGLDSTGTNALGQVAYFFDADTLTSASTYTVTPTATTTSTLTLSNAGLTTGNLLNLSATSTPTGSSNATINTTTLTDAGSSTGTTIGNGLIFTNNATATHTQNAFSISNAAVGSFTDTTTETLLLLDQADTTGAGNTAVTNAINITNSGGSTLTNAITIGTGSQAILNGINIASTGVTNDIVLQNGEGIDNNTDNQINLALGASGTLLLTSTTTASITNSAGALGINAQATGLNLQADGAIDVNIAGGSGATGCTVANSTGNLTCTGNITGAAAGTVGYWTRTGTSLSPATANDVLSITSNDNTNSTFSLTNNTVTTLGAGVNTAGLIDVSSTSLSTGNLLNLETTTGLTSGRVLNLSTTSTGVTGSATTGSLLNLSATGVMTSSFVGNLGYVEWAPTGAATAAGNLFTINIGANGTTTGDLFQVQDSGSDLFRVNESIITAALPTEFTSPGDVSMAYDLNFTNQTASFINSNGPLTISAGESFESNPLTMQVFNAGSVVVDGSTDVNTGTTGVLDLNVNSLTSGNIGFNVDYVMDNGAGTGNDQFASVINLNANDADGDLFGVQVNAANTALAAAGSYESLLVLNNNETTADSVTDYLRITTASADTLLSDAIDVSDADLFNAIYAGANFMRFDGIRAFEGTTGTLTIEDTSGNDLCTIVDGGTTGTISCTGTGALASTLQNAYDNDVDGGNATITLTAADDGLVITNPDATGNNLSTFVLQVNQSDTNDAVVAMDITQTSNNANGVNLTAANIDGEIGLNVTTNGLTTGSAIAVTSSGTIASGGELLSLAATGISTGRVIDLTAATNTLTTGTLISATTSSTGLTNAGSNVGSLLDLTESGAMTAFVGNLASISASSINNVGNTGNALNINLAGAGNIMKAINITDNSTGALTNGAFYMNMTGAHTGTALRIDDVTLTGTLALLSDTALTSGTILNLTNGSGTALTAGAGIANGGTNTGSLLNVASTGILTTSFTGNLGTVDWSPTGAATIAGNLLTVNIGTNGTTTGDLFQVQDSGSDLFRVNESIITSALPHEFTSAGDVSMAYDLIMTNETSSKIQARGPLTIEQGDNFESNPLTLMVYNAGNVVVDGSTDQNSSTVGVVDINVNTATTGNIGLNQDYTVDAGSGTAFSAAKFNMTLNDVDGGLSGVNIINNATAAAVGTGDITCILCIDNAENTANVVTDFIRITNTGNTAHTAGTAGTGLNMADTDLGTDIILQGGESIDNDTADTIVLASNASNGAGVARLPVKTTTGDPALNVEGNIYYNAFDDVFRCYQGVAWTNCINSGSGTTLQQAYDNDANGSDSIIELNTSDDSIVFSNANDGNLTDSAFVLSISQAAPTAATSALDITQASNAFDAVNITANTIDTENGIDLVANGLTTGTAINVASSGTIASGGELLSLAATGISTGRVIDLTAATNTLTTGTLISATTSSTGLTNAGTNVGSLLDLTESGAVTAFVGNLASISASSINNVGNTGNALNINLAGAANIMKALNITDNSTGALTNGAVYLNMTGAHTGTALRIDDVTLTGTLALLSDTVLTTGTVLNLTNGTGTALTAGASIANGGTNSGSLLNVASTGILTTSFTGNLGTVDWSPTGAATVAGNLLTVNIGTNGTTSGDLFQVQDSGSDLFRVNESIITSAIPHEFTSPGDVSMAYDLILTNQTSSFIKSLGPTTFEAGESFESNNLTLKTYNAGDVAVDQGLGGSLDITTAIGVRTGSAIDINENNTTGTVASITWDSAETRGGMLTANLTGALTTENFIDINTTAAWTSNLVDITTGAQIWTGNMFDLNVGAAASTGDIFNVDMGTNNVAGGAFVVSVAGGARTDAVIDITSASTGNTDAGSIVQLNATGALASGANILDINASGGVGGNGLDITTSGTLMSGNLIDLNMGTGIADTGDAINIALGSTGTAAQALVITDAAVSTVNLIDVTANSIATAKLANFTGNGLTTGTMLDLNSTSAVMTLGSTIANGGTQTGSLLDVSLTGNSTFSGNLGTVDWSPTSSTVATGDLFQINIGTNGSTSGNLLAVSDGNTNLFSVSETVITSAIPHQFTAAGDVNIAYDLQFTNQTATSIKANAPLTIDAGEAAESNNLTLKVYNAGSVQVDASSSVNTSVGGALDLNVNSLTSGNIGFNIDYVMNNTAGTGNDQFAQKINLTANDADADQFGLVITSNDTSVATTGSYETLVTLNNLETSANAVTDYLLITTSAADTTSDAIDVSDTDFANAINVGGNNIFSTVNINMAGTATGTSATGLILPTKTDSGDPTATQVNGEMYYNSNSGKFRCYESATWKDCVASGATPTLQNAYDNDANGTNTTIELSTNDDSLIFSNANDADLTDSAFVLSISQAVPAGAVSALDITQSSNNANAVNITTNSIDTETGIALAANGLTTGSGISVTSTGTIVSGGELLSLAGTGITTGRLLDITSAANTLSSGQLVNVSTSSTNVSGSATTGSLLNLSATGVMTSTFVGNLAYLGYDSTSGTSSGNLFTLNINAGATTTGDLFQVQDGGSDLFRVNETVITSALPHEFTAAGDVSIAYDIQFTNQTSSFIKAKAPLTIDAGESFESNTLTLKTYNSGDIALDMGLGGSLDITTATGVRTGNAIDINENNTTGTVASIAWDSAETRGGFMDLALTGALATENFIDLDTSGAWTSNLVDITTGAQVWTGNMFDLNVGAAASTGDIFNVDMGTNNVAGGAFVVSVAGGARTDAVIDITSASTGNTDAGSIMQLNATGALGSGANILDINASGGVAGNGLDITTSGTLMSGNLIDLNMGTAIADTGDALNIAIGSSSTAGQAIVIADTAASTVNIIDVAANTTATGKLANFAANALTTGTMFDLNSTSSVLTVGATIANSGSNVLGSLLDVSLTGNSTFSGNLGTIDWSPTSATTASGDLFQINIGTNGTTTGNLFTITDAGTNLFSVKENIITSALPHEFTAAGDVNVAYDLQFTNQTATSIRSNAPLTIEAGESSENNNLTLKTFGTGKIIADGAFSVNSQAALAASATPSVGDQSYYTTPGGQTFTNFTNGVAGQIIFIEHVDATTDYDCTGSNLNCGTTDITTTATGDASAWIYDGTDWHLIAFMDDSDNHEAGNGFDLAELFVSNEALTPGDVVSISPTESIKVVKGTDADNQRIIGIVTTTPGLLLGEQIEGTNAYGVALAGRVPVKVDPTSEAILNGDFVSASATSGMAKKVTGGYILGRALQTWNPNTGQETVEVFVNPIYINESQDQVTANMTNLQDQLSLMQSQLDLLTNNQPGNSIAELTVEKIKVNDELTVLGDTTLADTVINGKLNIGTIQFDNVTNSIDAVGKLRIQPLALGDVEFMGGLITFDTNGNIKAKEVTAEKYNVDSDSVGTGTILAGQTTVFVPSTKVTANSLIFTNSKTPIFFPISVTSKTDGIGFTVELYQSESMDVNFDWWIVDKLTQN